MVTPLRTQFHESITLNNVHPYLLVYLQKLLDLPKRRIMSLPPASGTGRYFARAAKSIRLIRHGCTNRPFFHISVTHRKRVNSQPVIEQLGSYDPMANVNNEKLVALNLERIKYWLGHGAHVTTPVAELLGLSGFFPIHPRSYMIAWRHRRAQRENQAKMEAEKAKETPAA